VSKLVKASTGEVLAITHGCTPPPPPLPPCSALVLSDEPFNATDGFHAGAYNLTQCCGSIVIVNQTSATTVTLRSDNTSGTVVCVGPLVGMFATAGFKRKVVSGVVFEIIGAATIDGQPTNSTAQRALAGVAGSTYCSFPGAPLNLVVVDFNSTASAAISCPAPSPPPPPPPPPPCSALVLSDEPFNATDGFREGKFNLTQCCGSIVVNQTSATGVLLMSDNTTGTVVCVGPLVGTFVDLYSNATTGTKFFVLGAATVDGVRKNATSARKSLPQTGAAGSTYCSFPGEPLEVIIVDANATATAAITCISPNEEEAEECHAPTCGIRPGCHGGIRDGRECRTDDDCPMAPSQAHKPTKEKKKSDDKVRNRWEWHNADNEKEEHDERHEQRRAYCVPLADGCRDTAPCRNDNCTERSERTSRTSCETCLMCTDDEWRRGRAGCCRDERHRHQEPIREIEHDERSDDDDDDHSNKHHEHQRRNVDRNGDRLQRDNKRLDRTDKHHQRLDADDLRRRDGDDEDWVHRYAHEENGAAVCDRSRASYEHQCGRMFTCECAHRPCRDSYDIFGADERRENICHAVWRHEITALGRHGLPREAAVLFADGRSDFYFLDARETLLEIRVKLLNTHEMAFMHAKSVVRVELLDFAKLCTHNDGGDAADTDDKRVENAEITEITGDMNKEESERSDDDDDDDSSRSREIEKKEDKHVDENENLYSFSVRPGKYIVAVHIDGVDSSRHMCAEYDIAAVTHAPICPHDALPCSAPHCFSTRECPRTSSPNGCDSLRSRCIESIFGDDHEDEEAERDQRRALFERMQLRNDHHEPLVLRPQRAEFVCVGAHDGAPCIDQRSDSLRGLCTAGHCRHERCVVHEHARTFPCDCTCAPRCNVDAECNDGNAQTDDFCIHNTHQCVNSPTMNRPPRTSSTRSTPAPTTAFNASAIKSVGAPVRSLAASPIVSIADKACVRVALDAAERAYAASSMDRVGAFDAKGVRIAPIRTADGIRDVDVMIVAASPLHALESTQCCAAAAIRSYCLGGEERATHSARQWSDIAYLALDNAHRAAQSGAASLAVRDACCAAMIYEAIGTDSGRVGDQWQLAGARVLRIEEFDDVGARCIATDDGHPDKDLNDFVFEHRRVDLMCDGGRWLCAVNLHTLPLAHGGGHRTSLAVVTGDELSLNSAIVDNGKCAPRLRNAMPAEASAALVRKELGARTPALPSGSFGERVIQTLYGNSDSLIAAVGNWTTCTTIGPVGTTPCPRGDLLVLYENTRAPFPLSHPDTLEWFTRSAESRTVYREATTNTQRGTRRVRPLFAVSATMMIAPTRDGSLLAKPVEAVRLLVRNEDCGVAALVDSLQMVDSYETPLTISVPASACASWRWADEGQPVFATGDKNQRWCRGGEDSALVTCALGGADICSEGGTCAPPAVQSGVPYPYGWMFFQCAARGVRCDVPNADPRCCDEKVRRWYAYSTPALLYSESD